MRKLPFRFQKRNFGKTSACQNTSSGQALLLVMLSMAVILTVALSVASRSVVDITTTTYEEDAMRAFSAAEAGVEEALLTQQSASAALPGGAEFDAPLTETPAGDNYNYPTPLASGESATFWFVSHDADGNLSCVGDCLTSNGIQSLCWGEPGTLDNTDGVTPAIELSVYYDDDQGGVASGNFDDVVIVASAFDSHDTRHTINKFIYATNGSCTIGNKTYPFSVDASELSFVPPAVLNIPGPCRTVAGCLLMAKVRVLYNDKPQSVGLVMHTMGTQLPAQGIQIESVGEAGESTRKVNVFRGYPEPPDVFDFAVFSMNSLGP